MVHQINRKSIYERKYVNHHQFFLTNSDRFHPWSEGTASATSAAAKPSVVACLVTEGGDGDEIKYYDFGDMILMILVILVILVMILVISFGYEEMDELN